MPVIKTSIEIRAPIERVFDLARSIDLHVDSARQTGERALAGVTSGLISLGGEVTWGAKHLGVWQELTVRVTQYERPAHFRDSMVKGAFKRFDHDHFFAAQGEVTLMNDVFDFDPPGGWLGMMASGAFLTNYMRGFLELRNKTIKEAAESDAWRRYLEKARMED